MRAILPILFFLILLNSCKKNINENFIYNYPKIEKQKVTEEYCGVKVTDDYRNLENLKDSSVVKWFKEQEGFTKDILNQINGSEKLFEKMKSYSSRNEFETYSIRVLTNGNYFF